MRMHEKDHDLRPTLIVAAALHTTSHSLPPVDPARAHSAHNRQAVAARPAQQFSQRESFSRRPPLREQNNKPSRALRSEYVPPAASIARKRNKEEPDTRLVRSRSPAGDQRRPGRRAAHDALALFPRQLPEAHVRAALLSDELGSRHSSARLRTRCQVILRRAPTERAPSLSERGLVAHIARGKPLTWASAARACATGRTNQRPTPPLRPARPFSNQPMWPPVRVTARATCGLWRTWARAGAGVRTEVETSRCAAANGRAPPRLGSTRAQ